METIYSFSKSAETLIEKIIDDDAAMINQIILNKGDIVPKHKANSNVYLIITKGTITLHLDEDKTVEECDGHIINIPYGTEMEITNQHEKQLSFFVVKSPSPRVYNADKRGQ